MLNCSCTAIFSFAHQQTNVNNTWHVASQTLDFIEFAEPRQLKSYNFLVFLCKVKLSAYLYKPVHNQET